MTRGRSCHFLQLMDYPVSAVDATAYWTYQYSVAKIKENGFDGRILISGRGMRIFPFSNTTITAMGSTPCIPSKPGSRVHYTTKSHKMLGTCCRKQCLHYLVWWGTLKISWISLYKYTKHGHINYKSKCLIPRGKITNSQNSVIRQTTWKIRYFQAHGT